MGFSGVLGGSCNFIRSLIFMQRNIFLTHAQSKLLFLNLLQVGPKGDRGDQGLQVRFFALNNV